MEARKTIPIVGFFFRLGDTMTVNLYYGFGNHYFEVATSTSGFRKYNTQFVGLGICLVRKKAILTG